PAVTAGATLATGTEVGLVGQTGHATGPHLHLQLNPATSYPQEQSWFQSFAGTLSAGRTPARATPELRARLASSLSSQPLSTNPMVRSSSSPGRGMARRFALPKG